MKSLQQFSRYMILPILLIVIMAGCTQESNTEDPDVYTPECTVQELIKAIDDANADGVPSEIQLPANCVYTLTKVENTLNWNGLTIPNGLPIITSEITIQGNNAVIEIQRDPGEAHFGHFFLDYEKKLKLYDLTLRDGARNIGGAVISNHGDFVAYNVKFINNLAYPEDMDNLGKGGAIYSYFGKVRISANSFFQQNMAGWTLSAGSNLGGAIYSFNSSLAINNSYFYENYAAGHGGAVYTVKTPAYEGGGMLTVQNSEFAFNSALEDGGGFYIKDELNGAIIVTGYFSENTAEGFGGAIYSEDSDVKADFSDFYGNQANRGGAVYSTRTADGVVSSFLSENSIYSTNTAVEAGGAILARYTDVELEDATISFNQADSCGAIVLGNFLGSDFGTWDLGAAPAIETNSEIVSSVISSNEALDGFGGAVCHLMGELIIRESSINNNLTPSYGGALVSMEKLEVIDSEFIGNAAERGGGLAVGYMLSGSSNISPSFMDFHSYIRHSNISDNTASDSGGGIWAHHGGSLYVGYSTVGGNTASSLGGGIYQQEGNLFIANSTLAVNTAFRGGGLYNEGDNSIVGLTHTTVAYNNATDGGSELRSGGGGVNINGTFIMDEPLIVQNTNKDCDLNQGLDGDYDTDCGQTYCAQTIEGVDSDGTCGFQGQGRTETNPLMGAFNGIYVPIYDGSPLIDKSYTSCYLSDDQIGTPRRQGFTCEPGSIEYLASPPSPPPPAPLPSEPSEETGNCDPFAGQEISVHLLNIDPQSLTLPVYLRFTAAVPDLGGDGSMPYRGVLGGWLESSLCNQQGFEDRLYCMFTLQSSTPGTLQDLEIYKEDCPNPVFTQPRLTIPEVPVPSSTCNKDLGENACEDAGGIWPDVDDPYCICP